MHDIAHLFIVESYFKFKKLRGGITPQEVFLFSVVLSAPLAFLCVITFFVTRRTTENTRRITEVPNMHDIAHLFIVESYFKFKKLRGGITQQEVFLFSVVLSASVLSLCNHFFCDTNNF